MCHTEDPETTPTPDPALGTDPAPTEVTPSPAPQVTRHAVRPEMAGYASNLYAANTLFIHRLSDRTFYFFILILCMPENLPKIPLFLPITDNKPAKNYSSSSRSGILCGYIIIFLCGNTKI